MSVNGIYGLASGLDIDSLVTQAMTGKQTQYDSIYKKEQTAEWMKDAYNTWYEKLIDFQNNTLYQYALSSGMDPKTAASSATSVVTATAGGAAASLSHKVTVSTLASNAYLKTTDAGITRATSDSTSIKLSDLIGMSNVTLTSSSSDTASSDTLTYTDSSGNSITLTGSQMDETAISFTVRDGSTTTDSDNSTSTSSYKTISYTYRDLAESTLNDLATDLTDSGTNVGGIYDSVNDSFSIYNKNGGASNTIDLTVDSVTNNISDEGAASSNSNTRKLLSALNLGQSDGDSLGSAISASYSTDSDGYLVDSSSSSNADLTTTSGKKIKFNDDGSFTDEDGNTLTTDSSGYLLDADGNKITDSAGDAVTASSLVGFSNTPDNVGSTSTSSSSTAIKGINGSVTIDGKNYSTTGTQITADGVTYTLLSTGSGTVTVSNDTATIIKNVKQFVSDYNTLLSSLKDAIYTEPDSDYGPLTTAEKKSMSEDQITQWETKAKTGLLYKDDTLSTLVDSMRSAVNTKISGLSGSYTSLASIGITVSSDWSTDSSGILSLDEDTLSAALASDPDAVYKIFDNPSYDKTDSSTYGVVKRLNTALSTAIGSGSLGSDATGLKEEAGTTDSSNYSDQSYWGDKITALKKQLSDFQDAMDKYEDGLYDQFDAMETAISNLNSQYTYISSYTSS